MIGIEKADRDKFHDWSDSMMAAAGVDSAPEVTQRASALSSPVTQSLSVTQATHSAMAVSQMGCPAASTQSSELPQLTKGTQVDATQWASPPTQSASLSQPGSTPLTHAPPSQLPAAPSTRH